MYNLLNNFNKNSDEMKYSNDLKIKEIRTVIKTIGTYLAILVVWQFTLSFQSSMYTVMNTFVFVMFAMGAAGLIFCREEQSNIIKNTKKFIFYYLIIVFIYDMFFKIVANNLLVSQTLGEVDQTLIVARQFILTMSTILKISIPIAYITWMLQEFGVFKSGITKKKQMQVLRDVRENPKQKIPSQESNIDRF